MMMINDDDKKRVPVYRLSAALQHI